MKPVWAIHAALPCMLGVLGLVAGCAVGPDYHAPAWPAGADAPFRSADPAIAGATPPPDDWWQLYADPALDALIREAFAANTDLNAAQANLSGARAVLEAANAGRYPSTSLNLGAIYGRDAVTDEILEIGGHVPQTTWIFDATLDVTYELDLFGRVRRSIEAASAELDAAAAARDDLKVTIAAETARAYVQVCALGEEIAVAQRSVAVATQESDITGRRLAAGAASPFDLVRAQGVTARTRASLPALEGERRAALFELSALLGRTPSRAPFDVLDCVKPPPLLALLPTGDGLAMLRRRPDVREAEREVAAATARIGVATADLYPRISLIGLGGGINAQLDNLTNALGLTWGIGPSISWTFPNQALPRARVRQAKANAQAALARLDSVVLRALKETEQSLARYNADLHRRQDLNDAQRLAHQAFDFARAQRAVGSLSALDLLTTEETMIEADRVVADSDADLIQDQINVFKSLGGGWR